MAAKPKSLYDLMIERNAAEEAHKAATAALLADMKKQADDAIPELNNTLDAIVEATGRNIFNILGITDGMLKDEIAVRAKEVDMDVPQFMGIVIPKTDPKTKGNSKDKTMTPEDKKKAEIKKKYQDQVFMPKGEFAGMKKYKIGTQGRFPAHIVTLYDEGRLEEFLEPAPGEMRPEDAEAK